jgi:integrase
VIRGPYLVTVAEQWVDDIGYRNPTRRSYFATLRAFDRRVRTRRPGTRFNEITPDDVKDFVLYREDGQLRADRSRKQTVNICWSLWDWATAAEIGLATSNPVTRLRAQHRRERRLPQDVIRKVWLGEERARLFVATTRGDGTDPNRLRDAFLIALYLYTALRLSELWALRWRDVDLAAGQHGILHVVGKGHKVAQVPLNKAARKLLFEWRSAYITGYGSADIDDLCLVPRLCAGVIGRVGLPGPQPREPRILWGRPLAHSSSIAHMIRKRAAEAGLGHVATHDLRRTAAGIMKDRGADLEEIRRALRHTSAETTRIYLEAKPELSSVSADYDLG